MIILKERSYKYKGIPCYVRIWKDDQKNIMGKAILAVSPEPFVYFEPFRSEQAAFRFLMPHALKAWQAYTKTGGPERKKRKERENRLL
jgi:hypothetical protein